MARLPTTTPCLQKGCIKSGLCTYRLHKKKNVVLRTVRGARVSFSFRRLNYQRLSMDFSIVFLLCGSTLNYRLLRAEKAAGLRTVRAARVCFILVVSLVVRWGRFLPVPLSGPIIVWSWALVAYISFLLFRGSFTHFSSRACFIVFYFGSV